jgi:hypothetical protein
VPLFEQGRSWDLPASEGLQVLESRLRETLPGLAFDTRQGDLYSIAKAERDAVLDAMLTGQGFPFVLLDGVVVHAGDLEAATVAEALRAVS